MKSINKYIFSLGVITSCIGCGGYYYAEKTYWHVNRKHGETIRTPAEATEKEFHQTINALKKVVSGYPAWKKSAEIQFRIGEMYIARKDFDNARKELMEVVMNFPEQQELCAHAQFLIGSLFEKQGDWKEALHNYEELIERYPNTTVGLQVPLYIAHYYQRHNLKKESERTYADATHKYTNLIEKNPYSKLVPVIQYFVTLAYGRQEKWNELVDTLQRMVDKYPDAEVAPVTLYRMAAIYRDVLHNPDKAKDLYNKIILKYPNSRLQKDAQLQLANISILQSNDIEQVKISDKNTVRSD